MLRCLIVDDSAVIRKMIKNILNNIGVESIEAENGLKALEQCNLNQLDFIILDWNMPEMNGFEFLKAFRKETKWQNIKVIFCTTENSLDNIQQAITNGADEYVMKPFDEEIIKAKLIQIGLLS
jgi:two-component system chemotaxis response regulator CheY